ncbi:GTP-binding protein [Streptomyces xanthochromogenes]|nr:GTP-binding protein [Streptomyces xanthochromogenes]
MADITAVRPQVNLAIMGKIDDGRDHVSAALSSILEEQNGVGASRADTDGARGTYPEFRTAVRDYLRFQVEEQASPTNPSTARADGVLLVLSALEDNTDRFKELVALARTIGAPAIVVYINKTDVLDDDGLVGLMEMELREILDKADYPGDTTPIIAGSALQAMSGDPANRDRILQLAQALDTTIPQRA